MANLGFHYCFTKPPSYLRELLKQDAEICLVHDTVSSSLQLKTSAECRFHFRKQSLGMRTVSVV